jgi:hypothetical protein
MHRFLVATLLFPVLTLAAPPAVQAIHPPGGGVQPQAAVDSAGVTHLIYLTGDERMSDVMYATSKDGGRTWGKPLRVNSQLASAIAAGTVRGAHLAIGKGNRPHVAWMGSKEALPPAPGGGTPMLYTRLNDAGTAFEPQRNLITRAPGLDGGGSIAADDKGNVYVAWHAPIPGRTGEANRTVWLTTSKDDGKTFAPETQMLGDLTGVCGCCGMRLGLDAKGNLVALYRAANSETRDIYLLTPSANATFTATKIDTLAIKTCPMSTASMARAGDRVVAAWESGGQVSIESFDLGSAAQGAGAAIGAPGKGNNRKHPSVAVNKDGQTLLAWTEGTGWKRGGTIAWQLYDSALKPIAGASGTAPQLAAWSLPTAVANGDGSFTIVY